MEAWLEIYFYGSAVMMVIFMLPFALSSKFKTWWYFGLMMTSWAGFLIIIGVVWYLILTEE